LALVDSITTSRQVDSLTGINILATGSYAPEQRVLNEDLAEHGYDADWIIQRTGIECRHQSAPGEATSDVALQAARNCLEQANADPSEIDLILVATITPDQQTPSTACLLQHKLGSNAPAMDIGAACAGFMYALVTAAQFIKTGTYERILVVGADLMTHTVNPEDKKTFPLFGDGAGAVLIGPGNDSQGLLGYTLGADGEGGCLLHVPSGGTLSPLTSDSINDNRHFLEMDGRAVFKWAVRMLASSVNQVLNHTNLSIDDLDLAVFHQANIRILDAARENLGLPIDKVIVNLHEYGNTSAASIPLALDEANRSDRINPGDKILLSGFGAGLTWGTAIIQW